MGLIQDYLRFLSNGGLIPYFIQGLGYLRDRILPPAPSTNPVAAPYTPPFSGGQCSILYDVQMRQKNADGSPDIVRVFRLQGAISAPFDEYSIRDNNGEQRNYQYQGFKYNNGASTFTWRDEFVTGSPAIRPKPNSFSIDSVSPVGGSDNCGDLPNPNAALDIAKDGIAESAAPNLLSGAASIISGTPLSPSGGDSLASGANNDFSEAGALAPSDIAGALAKIAAGLAKVAQILSLFNEILDLLRKLINKNNKSSFRYDFGAIQKDGFVNMIPSSGANKIEWQFLDIQITEIRTGSGKIFGSKSPNYYLYEPIGRISFVSPTFGVLSTHPIQFIRTSVPIPPLAIGFFYHLGLDGTNKANVSGFYLKQEE